MTLWRKKTCADSKRTLAVRGLCLSDITASQVFYFLLFFKTKEMLFGGVTLFCLLQKKNNNLTFFPKTTYEVKTE